MAIIITGDIGAGKSTATKILAQKFSCETFDADVIAKEYWQRGRVKAPAFFRWGKRVFDSSGNIVLPEISKIIFSNKDEHDFCCKLIHPFVMQELKTLTQNIDAVIEIPLLAEAGRPKWAEKVFYIAASFENRVERCKARGWDAEELSRREKFLLPRDERMKICDVVIQNDGDISELERQLLA